MIDSDITEQIQQVHQYNGAEAFSKNLESFDFSADVFEKLDEAYAVRYGRRSDEELLTDEIRTRLTARKVVQSSEEKYDEAYASSFIKGLTRLTVYF